MTLLLLACSQSMPVAQVPSSDPTAAWEELLKTVVSAEGRVYYAGLAEQRGVLDDYVAWIAAPADPPLEGDAALAQAINAYNAFVLLGVLENQPLDSVRDLSVGIWAFGGSGFFKGLKFQYQGRTVDLYGLENDHIREEFQDPRIHGAINCASAGCPPLRRGLYQADRLDGQLDEGMRRFLRERSRIEDGQAVFSEIFDWFGEDFTDWGDAESLCHYAAGFDPAFAALAEEGCPHRFETYDWSLNSVDEAPPPPPMEPLRRVQVKNDWPWPPSPGDCPPGMRPSQDRCAEDSAFGPLPGEHVDLAERLHALGGRFLCDEGICAPPNPRLTTCGVLFSTEGCDELRDQERAWEAIRTQCAGKGAECILTSKP